MYQTKLREFIKLSNEREIMFRITTAESDKAREKDTNTKFEEYKASAWKKLSDVKRVARNDAIKKAEEIAKIKQHSVKLKEENWQMKKKFEAMEEKHDGMEEKYKHQKATLDAVVAKVAALEMSNGQVSKE
ncbi:hypothetical protein NKR23_g10303 [Pleurostoma richardsiae]|uniref:Uncharacterized protein n=1 Tax=Pleurostoma richardsiae TaxID=41990 RepID=A0AA38R5B6_9PEZI|nr:hypothetical protein NKR23_g10303 [Pleurostoma richardsiae]